MLQCPLCPYQDADSYALGLHVEVEHFGQESPFVARDTSAEGAAATSKQPLNKQNRNAEDDCILDYAHDEREPTVNDDGEYLPCPEPDCGEEVLWRDLQEHLDFHLAEHLGSDDQFQDASSASSASRNMYAPFPYPYHSSPADDLAPSSSLRANVPQTCSAADARVDPFSIILLQNPSPSSPFTQPPPIVYPSTYPLNSGTSRSPSYTELWCENQSRIVYSHGYSDVGDEAGHDTKRRRVISSSSSGKSCLSRRSEVTVAADARKRGLRMGKAELGPYAFESQMPSWLRKLLIDGGKRTKLQRLTSTGQLYTTTQVENEIRGLVPVVADLLEDDFNVKEAWLCHPAVQHVFKLPKEGGFCGYRNIQMMLSFILGTEWTGCDRIVDFVAETDKSKKQDKNRIPNIFNLQDMIERGWEIGYSPHSRAETGGIRGSRKYIGTPEVQSLLASLNIPHGTFTCTDKIYAGDHPLRQHAHDQLLDQVQRYFASGEDEGLQPDGSNGRVHRTRLPPLFLQQPGHSLTIIGVETHTDGKRKLLVFDPAYKPSAGITKMLNRRMQDSPTSPRKLKKPHPEARSNTNKQAEVKFDNKATDSTFSSLSLRDWPLKPGSAKSKTLESPAGTLERSRGGLVQKRGKVRSDRARQQAAMLLEAYRRGEKRLGRHREFEMLRLVPVHDDDDDDEDESV